MGMKVVKCKHAVFELALGRALKCVVCAPPPALFPERSRDDFRNIVYMGETSAVYHP